MNRISVIICLNCGQDFTNPARQGPDRKFCSPHCKDKWWAAERSRQRQIAPPRPCRGCGGPAAHKTGIPVCQDCRIDDRSRPYKRAVQLKARYGLTQADYDGLVARQGDQCAICRTVTPGGRGGWRVDHDHVTGQVRGLLCDDCNLGIGKLQDDPEILVAAARYVAAHRKIEPLRKAG